MSNKRMSKIKKKDKKNSRFLIMNNDGLLDMDNGYIVLIKDLSYLAQFGNKYNDMTMLSKRFKSAKIEGYNISCYIFLTTCRKGF